MNPSLAGLRWRIEGEGTGLVLVHGWALALDYWDTVLPLLARQFRVLRFDRRGFGGSSGTPSLVQDCSDLFALMDEAGMPQAAVLGMSQGARVAMAAAQAQPQRVTALVLDGPPWLGGAESSGGVSPEQELPLDELQAKLRNGGAVALQRALLQLPLLRLVNATDAAADALRRCVESYRGLDLAGSGVTLPHVRLPDVRTPTFIINGDQESATRLQAGQHLLQNIAGARFSRIAAAGHLAALDAPAAWCEAISGFLSARRR